MEIDCASKWLTDNARTYDRTVPGNHLAIGLIRPELSQSSNHKWISQTQEQGCNDCHQEGSDDVFFHIELPLCQADRADDEIDRLDSDKGHDHSTQSVN